MIWKSVVCISLLRLRADRPGQEERFATPMVPRSLLTVLDGVTLVLNLSTLGNEALTTFLATTLDDVTTGFSSHAGAESVLILA